MPNDFEVVKVSQAFKIDRDVARTARHKETLQDMVRYELERAAAKKWTEEYLLPHPETLYVHDELDTQDIRTLGFSFMAVKMPETMSKEYLFRKGAVAYTKLLENYDEIFKRYPCGR